MTGTSFHLQYIYDGSSHFFNLMYITLHLFTFQCYLFVSLRHGGASDYNNQGWLRAATEVLLDMAFIYLCCGAFVTKGCNLTGDWYKVILGWGRGTESAGKELIWDRLFKDVRDPKPLEAQVRLDLCPLSTDFPWRRTGEVTMAVWLGRDSKLLEDEERDLILGRPGRDVVASMVSISDPSAYWRRYSGYTWCFSKITKMEGLQTLSTQLSYRHVSSPSFGGGLRRPDLPWVCSPARTRQTNIALVPSWLVYLWEYEASLAK